MQMSWIYIYIYFRLGICNQMQLNSNILIGIFVQLTSVEMECQQLNWVVGGEGK